MSALDLSAATFDVHALSELVPPATLAEARDHRAVLARLLAREREAAADFLLALADFDRRRGWERLGHPSLFAFLTRELGLSNGAAWLRLTAARLLPRFPAIEEALRQGRLCLSAVGELSKVLSPENQAELLPRFFGRSAREARELAAAIRPDPAPPRREVVTMVPSAHVASPPGSEVPPQVRAASATASLSAPALAGTPRPAPLEAPLAGPPLLTSEVTPSHLAREERSRVEPLTADLRRLHLTVSAGLLQKLSVARDGLSHALPGATMEQVIEAALELLLEKQARAKALVKHPRSRAAPAPAPSLDRRAIPAQVEREVRLRDGDRCQWPLDAGGVCGSTWQIELDHVEPLALGGASTVGNLHCLCRRHNVRAAEEALGPAVASVRTPPPPRAPRSA